MQALDPRSTLEKPVPDKIGASPYNVNRILYIRDKNYVLILGDDLERLKGDGFADYDERAAIGRFISNNLGIPKGVIETAKNKILADDSKLNVDSAENLETLAINLMADASATLDDMKKIVNFEFLGERIKSPPQRSPSRLDAKSSPSKKPKIDPTPEMYKQLFGHPEPTEKRGDDTTPLAMLKEMWQPYGRAVDYLKLKDARLRTFIGEGKNIYERLVSLHESQLSYIKDNGAKLSFKTVESVELGTQNPVLRPTPVFYVDVNRNVNQASTAALVLYSRVIPRQSSSMRADMQIPSDPVYEATGISSDLSVGASSNVLESALASTSERISFVGRDPGMSAEGFNTNAGLYVLEDKNWSKDKLNAVKTAAGFKNLGVRGHVVYMAKFDPENGKFGVLFPVKEDGNVGVNGPYTIYAFEKSQEGGKSTQKMASMLVNTMIEPSEISVSHWGHYVIGTKLYVWEDGMDGNNELLQINNNSNYLLIANNLLFHSFGTAIYIDRFEWKTPKAIVRVADIHIGEGIKSIDVYNRMAVVLFDNDSQIALVDILAGKVMRGMSTFPMDANTKKRPFATATTFGYVCMDTGEVRVCVDSMEFLPPAPALPAASAAAQPPENGMDVDAEEGTDSIAPLQKSKSTRRTALNVEKMSRNEVLRYVQLQLMHNYAEQPKKIPVEKKAYLEKLKLETSDYLKYKTGNYNVNLKNEIDSLCTKKYGGLTESDWNIIAAEDMFAVYKLVVLDKESSPPMYELSSPLTIRHLIEKNAYGILGVIGGYRKRYASPFTSVNILDTPAAVAQAMSTAAGRMRLRAHLMTGIADQIPAALAMESEKWEVLCDALEFGQHDYNLSTKDDDDGVDAETMDEDAAAETADEGGNAGGVSYDDDDA
jgi:hypothetical protein